MSEKLCTRCQTLKPVSDFKRYDTYRRYIIYKKCNECDEKEQKELEERYKQFDIRSQKELNRSPKWMIVYESFP